MYFDSPKLGIQTNSIKETIDLEICSILIFFEKGLVIVSPPHFTYDFFKK